MFYHMYECIEIWNVIHISLYLKRFLKWFLIIINLPTHIICIVLQTRDLKSSMSNWGDSDENPFFVWFLHLQRRANRSRWLAVKDLCKLENHCSFVCAEKSSNEEVGKDYIAALQPTTRPTPCSKSHTNSSSWSSNDHRWAIMINKQASKHQAGCQAPRQKTQIVKKDLWLASLSSLTSAVGYIISHCFKALKTN